MMATSPGFAPGPSGSKPGMLRLHHEAMNWSPGKVLPPRLLGVGQTRCYFTTGRWNLRFMIYDLRDPLRNHERLVNRKSNIVNKDWLPGPDLHRHSRLQRAQSCDWTT